MARQSLLFCLAFATAVGTAQEFRPSIPRAWSDNETTSFELPLAQADRSPKYPSAREYYALPVRPVYRTYPVYVADREPEGYWKSLQQKEPEVLFDPAKLVTKQDWIRAGALVFDQPIVFNSPRARERAFEPHETPSIFTDFRELHVPITRDGIIPGTFYIVRQKGVVELGVGSCAECHARVMPDGTVVKGAQGNFPSAGLNAWLQISRGSGPAAVQALRKRKSSLTFAPWAPNQDAWDEITFGEIIRRLQAEPPGVLDREGTSLKHPVKVPSLIGVQDIHYLDATGLSRNRNIGDLMRYAIVNQGLISMARFGDYFPGKAPEGGNTRYSDEQLYALALYIYSLEPPANPNPFDDQAKRGQLIFNHQGCSGCHPAPLYTNNKLTPVRGFTVPDALRKRTLFSMFPRGPIPG